VNACGTPSTLGRQRLRTADARPIEFGFEANEQPRDLQIDAGRATDLAAGEIDIHIVKPIGDDVERVLMIPIAAAIDAEIDAAPVEGWSLGGRSVHRHRGKISLTALVIFKPGAG
jgi:hypothetical protein